MTIFNDITPTASEVDSVKSSKHYESDVTPLEPGDNAPLTEAETKALNDALPSVQGQSPFADVVFDPSPPKGDYVPFRLKHRQRQAEMNVRSGHIKEQEDLLFEVSQHDGIPDELAKAIATARAAIAKAYDYRAQAAHPEAPGKVKSAKAKQAVVEALEDARTAVRQAIKVSERPDIREAQRDALVAGIQPARQRAAEALEVAAAAFAEWQSYMRQVRELDIASGRYDAAWHQHKDSHSIRPEALTGDLRRARDLANTESPFFSGEYLAEDPTPEGELPEWTAERLQRGNDFDRSVLWRLRKVHSADTVAQEALASKRLGHVYLSPVPALNREQEMWAEHARLVDPAQGL